ncbi:hypothetical protein U1Q18_021713 [Sarracenia purpurea var. burkii]
MADDKDVLSKRGSHLVRESAGDDHTVGLPRARPEDDAEPIEVVASSAGMHHFHGATGETESHGPDGACSGPVHQIVNFRDNVLCRLRHSRRRRCRRRQWGGVGSRLRRRSQRREGCVDRCCPL